MCGETSFNIPSIRRPSSWQEYYESVSPDNCTTPDGTASSYPTSQQNLGKYFVEGEYTGYIAPSTKFTEIECATALGKTRYPLPIWIHNCIGSNDHVGEANLLPGYDVVLNMQMSSMAMGHIISNWVKNFFDRYRNDARGVVEHLDVLETFVPPGFPRKVISYRNPKHWYTMAAQAVAGCFYCSCKWARHLPHK